MSRPDVMQHPPHRESYRLQTTRAPACGTATGTASDCESNVARFPFVNQLDAFCLQASRVKSDSASLLHRAWSLSLFLKNGATRCANLGTQIPETRDAT